MGEVACQFLFPMFAETLSRLVPRQWEKRGKRRPPLTTQIRKPVSFDCCYSAWLAQLSSSLHSIRPLFSSVSVQNCQHSLSDSTPFERNPIEIPCQPDEFKTELEVKRSSSVLVVTRLGNNTERSGQWNDSLRPAQDDT